MEQQQPIPHHETVNHPEYEGGLDSSLTLNLGRLGTTTAFSENGTGDVAQYQSAFEREAAREAEACSRWQHTAEVAVELAKKRMYSTSMDFIAGLSQEAEVSFTTAQRVYNDMKGRLDVNSEHIEFGRS